MNAQVDWLKSDLAKVDRTKTPWVVVSMHRPYYVSAQNDSADVCLDCQKAFEPLLISYDVDLVLHGVSGDLSATVLTCLELTCCVLVGMCVARSRVPAKCPFEELLYRPSWIEQPDFALVHC
jgi:Calcineurin-like phosphoesterase